MKIFGIGRNYSAHAKELGNEVPDEPVMFLMPETALIRAGLPFFYPPFTKEIDYEVELVIRINRLGKFIESKFAKKYYGEIGIGIDFTARDLQREAAEKGLPWTTAKGFNDSAPCSKIFIPIEELDLEKGIEFRLDKNGETVQTGNSKNMTFDFDQIIEHISRYFTLKKGDLIYTGTPAGVGPIQIGDRLEAYIGDQKLLRVDIR